MNTVRYLFALSVLVNFHSVVTMEENNKESESVKESAEELVDLVDAEKMVPFIEKELGLAGISLMSPEPRKGNYQIVAKKKIEENLHFIRGKLFLAGESNAFSYIAEEHLNNAARGLARYYIRILQDAACCSKKDYMNKRMEENFKYQNFTQVIERYLSKEKLNTLYLEQILLVKRMTNENKLPNPVWIMKYNWDQDTTIIADERWKQEIISNDKWKQERIKVLKMLKKQIKFGQ